MASGLYNIFLREVLKGTCNLSTDAIKCALMNNSHTFNATQADSSATGWASVSANEVSGSGYSAGGAALAGLSVTADDTDDEGVFDANDVSWSNSTISAYFAVLYDDTVTTPADILLCCFDFGGVKSSNNGTFTIQWATEGIINFTNTIA